MRVSVPSVNSRDLMQKRCQLINVDVDRSASTIQRESLQPPQVHSHY